jgi:hypothetical protein
MIARPGTPDRDDDEHSWLTLGDLAALVAGIAAVLVLPTRQSYWPYPTDFLGPWPRWLPWCFCLRQALGAACAALVPVILTRRARYGGLARPAEFLAICAALPFLSDSIETALIRWSYFRATGQTLGGRGLDGIAVAFTQEWSDESHWVWEHSLLLGGSVALGLFLLARRRLPGWLLTMLLAVAWLAAYEALTELARWWVAHVIPDARWQQMGETGALLVMAPVYHLPRFILYSVPAVAAIRDARRAGRVPPTWLERIGLGLAGALFLVAELTELIREYSVFSNWWPWVFESLVRAATMIIAIMLAFGIIRPGLRRRHRIEAARRAVFEDRVSQGSP